ncbi:MAG: hypothetical protein GWP91_18035 [Rhodobacterales bacterium]|nr:hypothetical protein [Rhodobacterales bacterium]
MAMPSGKSDGQRCYSDVAIEIVLTLRLVFGLPRRQTEGLLNSMPGPRAQADGIRGFGRLRCTRSDWRCDQQHRTTHFRHWVRPTRGVRGRGAWRCKRADTRHHQQARVENTFDRYKRAFRRGLKARTEAGQLCSNSASPGRLRYEHERQGWELLAHDFAVHQRPGDFRS